MKLFESDDKLNQESILGLGGVLSWKITAASKFAKSMSKWTSINSAIIQKKPCNVLVQTVMAYISQV